MVTKRRYIEEASAPPPPMDESWWDAVMAEDEMQSAPRSNYRPARHASSETRLDPLDVDIQEAGALDWEQAIELYEQDQVIQLEVTGCNRGGLLVCNERLHGFVPVSHLIETPCMDSDVDKWLQSFMGRTLNLKVIECDQERGRVVFSERAAQSLPGSRKYLLTTLQPGSCVIGVVTNITEFGVFVDLGGVEGLVHVSEISWGRVHHPADVLSLGQKVNVYVINVEPDRARVALSLKRLHPNPWETAEQRYHPGQVVDALITSIVPFGAFARLEEGLDGLIHISEFGSTNGLYSPAGMLREGQRLQVRILHVDASRQRLGLSLKLEDDLPL